MSLFRTQKMLHVHFPHFLLSAFHSLRIRDKQNMEFNSRNNEP